MYIQFVSIENDNQAEDLLERIQESRAETDRQIAVCNYKIEQYQNKKLELEMAHENNISNAMLLLGEYCRGKANHNTKTLSNYKLPSGKLQWKQPPPKVIKDDKALLEWIEANGLAYIKTERKPDWEALKKNAQVLGDHYCTQDGEIIEGVYLEEQPEVFEVK